MANKEISFYDLKTKKKFMSRDYKLVSKANHRFAVAKSPSGVQCWRAVSKE